MKKFFGYLIFVVLGLIVLAPIVATEGILATLLGFLVAAVFVVLMLVAFVLIKD